MAASAAAALLVLAVVADAGADGEPARAPSYPLVLLIQADGSDEAVRLRRVRVGDDVRAGRWRARVVFEGRDPGVPLAPLDGGRLPAGGAVRVTDAFVAFVPHRAFQIDAGPQRVPFTLSRQVDEADLRLPVRPAFIDAATPDFRAGLALVGDLGLLQYRAAVMSASTSLDGQLFDTGALAAMRVSADPIGPMGVTPWKMRADDPWYPWWRFSAGVSLLYGTLYEPRTLGVGADAQVQWLRFTATAEYVFLDATTRAHGAVVEPGFFIAPARLQLTARATWSRDAGADDAVSAGAGLTLYTHHAHLHWQAAFETGDVDWALLRLTLAL